METLYNRYRNWVIKVAYSCCNNDEDSQDILQETFKAFFAKFPGFKLTCQLKTYLFPIVRNKAIDLIRKRQKQLLADSSQQDQYHYSTQNLRDSHQIIVEMVCNLPKHHQDVIILRFVDGYSLSEIANQLKIPEGTVKSRLHKALKNLKQEYDSNPTSQRNSSLKLLLSIITLG